MLQSTVSNAVVRMPVTITSVMVATQNTRRSGRRRASSHARRRRLIVTARMNGSTADMAMNASDCRPTSGSPRPNSVPDFRPE